ncbi:hypothetical protein FSP39_021417 [Pinctada imbricata]|uniref:Uncharacterized protein n=1 Tax=Pinctada imbricata TaxID=66713 RepID=A0AA89BL71_PINIB|nr:hypothetical protein FSP39_021417 [Pinctada imbricata]
MTLKYVYNYVAKALLLRTVEVQIKPTYYDVIVQITPLRLYSYNHIREDNETVPSEPSFNGHLGETTDKNDTQATRPSKSQPSQDIRGTGRESPLEGWESPVKGEEPTENTDLKSRMSLHESAVGEDKVQTDNSQTADLVKSAEIPDTDRTGNTENIENSISKEELDSKEETTEREDTEVKDDTEVKVENGTIKGRADGRKDQEVTELNQKDSEVTEQNGGDDVKEDV